MRGFASVRARREFGHKKSDSTLGPGSYDTTSSLPYENSIQATIAKAGKKMQPYRTATDKRVRKRNKGSIRADFESDDEASYESDGENRGPGMYKTEQTKLSFRDYMSN